MRVVERLNRGWLWELAKKYEMVKCVFVGVDEKLKRLLEVEKRYG